MRPRLKLGGPPGGIGGGEERAGLGWQAGAEPGRKESQEQRRRFQLGQRLPRIFGDTRVYLKVSVLVEAGEAVRHFAAFTALRTTLSGSLLLSRDTRPLAPLPSSPPPPTPTQRAPAREGGSEKVGPNRSPRDACALQPERRNLPPFVARSAHLPGRPRVQRVRTRAGEGKCFRRERSQGARYARLRMFSTC